MSRCIDADALIDDLKHDVAMDQDSLDYEELTDSNREKIQFDKDCKQNAIDLLQHAPTIEPERKTGIPRDAIEYILQKETVSTNPYNFTANEKFIKFMDDPEIASFGRWQHANGFNTALVAVKCDLDKIPDSEPEHKTGRWELIDDTEFRIPGYRCSVCHCECEDWDKKPTYRFCPNCGSYNGGDANVDAES